MVVFKVLIDALVGLLFAIDNVVYGFIPILYRLLLYLANIDLVTGNVPVQGLIQRIYILVGVFMLFKLSFSIMNYIVNPDAFSDQAKGFSNLVRRVLIAIVLLVAIPTIFREAYYIQNKIISSGILPRLILGESIDYSDNNGNDELEDSIETSAKDVQFMLFGPFFSINYDSEDENSTEEASIKDCKPTPKHPTSNVIGTKDMASNKKCLESFAKLMDNSPEVRASGAYLSDFFRYEENNGNLADDSRHFDKLGSLLTLTMDNGDRVIKYYFIASTLCGGYLVFLLLSFCIDVAARVIRLLFLQILSPIAVISSIDPTSSGDRLKDWAKECLKVWASLFLRLLVIFLIVQLVRVISNSVYSGSIFSNEYSNSSNLSAWIYVFLILGVFQAAKNVPDLIEKATGIKMSGELQMNPFKALKENAGVGLGLAGVGIGATAVASGAANTLAGIVEGKGVLDTARSAVGGFFGGGYRSLRGAMSGEKGMKNFRNSFGSAMFARQQREDLERQGVYGIDVLKADLQRNLGLFTDAQRLALDDANIEADITAARQDLEARRSATVQEKENRKSQYTQISNAMNKISSMIDNSKVVSDAEKALLDAQASGDPDAIRRAHEHVESAKQQAFQDMLHDENNNNHRALNAYISQLNSLGVETGSFVGSNEYGEVFDKSVMYSSMGELEAIDASYASIEAGYIAEENNIVSREKELAQRKSDREHQIANASNKASHVNSPQPEGWMPTGEIQGNYRETRGPGAWNNGNRR